MGKRARNRGDRGKGASQRRKGRQLGLPEFGISKPILDEANQIAHELYSLGIGVLVQEEERERKIVASLETELDGVSWWRLRERRRIKVPLGVARRAQATWAQRLQEVTERVAESADSSEVQQWAAHR